MGTDKEWMRDEIAARIELAEAERVRNAAERKLNAAKRASRIEARLHAERKLKLALDAAVERQIISHNDHILILSCWSRSPALAPEAGQ